MLQNTSIWDKGQIFCLLRRIPEELASGLRSVYSELLIWQFHTNCPFWTNMYIYIVYKNHTANIFILF